MDRVSPGPAGLLLRISLGLCPREIPWSSPVGPRKTLSNPPLLFGLTQSNYCSASCQHVLLDVEKGTKLVVYMYMYME